MEFLNPHLCKLIFVNTRNANIYHFFLCPLILCPLTLKISNTAENKKPPKCRQNVSTSTFQHLYASKHHAISPCPLAKFREMNSNAAKNHVSISAPKQPVRCWNNTCPLVPKCPLTGSKIFVQKCRRRQAARPRSRQHEIFTKSQHLSVYIMLSRFVNTEREQMAGFVLRSSVGA